MTTISMISGVISLVSNFSDLNDSRVYLVQAPDARWKSDYVLLRFRSRTIKK